MRSSEETITWDVQKAAAEELLAQLAAVSEQELAKFDTARGVYVLGYAGTELPGSVWGSDDARIIYVGHAGRDSVRHFADDTAISTVRRSLAALLATSLELTAIPGVDSDDDRFNNYRLIIEDERKLSAWMYEHLRIAFYEVAPDLLEPMYHALLNYCAPLLNLKNNPGNQYGGQIKKYRKKLAEDAVLNSGRQE
ncbi:MAG: hypothetical protein Q4B96_04130 [Bacillota bacterium]|nr:hypothetical protein [Bacillota bacterium]